MLSRRDKLLIRPWQQKRFENHRRKVCSALPAIDNKPPVSYNHVGWKLKKQQLEKERIKRIEKENLILLQKLNHIMKTCRVDHFWTNPPPDFLSREPIYECAQLEIIEEDTLQLPPTVLTQKSRCLACCPEYQPPKPTIPEERVPWAPVKPPTGKQRSQSVPLPKLSSLEKQSKINSAENLSQNKISKNITKIMPAPTSTTNLQILRWRRKPRWVPVAKSKMFRVPQRPVITEDEQMEIKRLFNNYRTQMNSIKRYMVEKTAASLARTTDPKDIQRIQEEDFARCNKINDEWNASIQIERLKFFEDTLENYISSAEESLRKREQLDKLQLEEAEKLVAEQKEAAKTFITEENIGEAIEHALANPIDYNFAIDLDGNKHYIKTTQKV
ncbi:hypothetical protein Trydic_g13518 [Trypoxylus dichotomus]